MWENLFRNLNSQRLLFCHVLFHWNMKSHLKRFHNRFQLGEKRTPDEAYLAYLPLAHIFELTHEILVLSLGIKVGYSSPNTLTGNLRNSKWSDLRRINGDASLSICHLCFLGFLKLFRIRIIKFSLHQTSFLHGLDTQVKWQVYLSLTQIGR